MRAICTAACDGCYCVILSCWRGASTSCVERMALVSKGKKNVKKRKQKERNYRVCVDTMCVCVREIDACIEEQVDRLSEIMTQSSECSIWWYRSPFVGMRYLNACVCTCERSFAVFCLYSWVSFFSVCFRELAMLVYELLKFTNRRW